MEKPVKKWARNEDNKVFLAYQKWRVSCLKTHICGNQLRI